MRVHSKLAIGLLGVGMLTFAQQPMQRQPGTQQPGIEHPNNQPNTMGQANQPVDVDRTFATKAAQGGLAEVELGKLAMEKASSPDVKQFAQRMIDDHSKANDQLKETAGKDNITIPEAMDKKDEALKKKLERLSGPQFDRAYMTAMVKDHRGDVSEFKDEASRGSNADLKSFASSTLPTLQEHLKMAEDTLNKVKSGGNTAAAAPSEQK